MTQGVKDLIDAIASGDSVAIETAFNTEMATRISDRLEDMRVEVAQNMFRTESTQVDEEIELTEEQIDDLLESITDEDMEEINALEEATLSAKAGRAGKDLGAPGKNFAKIAAKAGSKYGSEEAGKRVAGAILAKMRAK